MSFTVRSHDTIRAALLADWRSRYKLRGWDLSTAYGSDAYMWADTFAFQAEGLEGRAGQLAREIFPQTASTAFLERHAAVIGMQRLPATRAQLTASITGTGSYTTSDRLVSASGVQYAPTVGGSIAGSGLLVVEALTAGAAGTLAADSALTWSPAPSGIDSAATVGEVESAGSDMESDADLAQRILAWWRDRPGGGNKADWVEWGSEGTGVAVAFVYRALHATLGPDTPGSVTLCVLGPASTTTTGAGEPAAPGTRALGSEALADLLAQILGTGDYEATGGHAPADIDPDDVFVVTITPQPQAVDVEIAPSGSTGEFPFTGTLSYSASTTTSITTAALPSGVTVGQTVRIAVPDAGVRGGYAYRETVVSHPADYVWTWAGATSVAPPAPGVALPIPQNADDVRAAVLAVFDALGPGQGADNEFSKRWPASAADYYPAILYRNSLVAALMGLPGVLGTQPVDGVEAVEVTLVGAGDPEKVTPTTCAAVTCGLLRLLPA